MMQDLEGLKGIIIVADDIMVFGEGSTDDEAEIDHDKKLTGLIGKISTCKYQTK